MSGYDPTIPKPMVPIGGKPILWHIMNIYAANGFRDFVLALGWLGEEIRRFFLHYEAMTRDFTVQLGAPGEITFLDDSSEHQWLVTCRDTGRDSLTGTRVKRAMENIDAGTFMVTYGDCVGDVDVRALVDFHRKSGRLATVTAVQPPSRFGELEIGSDAQVDQFIEKPQTSTGAINGGFMVFQKEVLDRYFPTDAEFMLEREPLGALAKDGELTAYPHVGFWQPMDTPREQQLLEDLWVSGQAPWKVWR